MDKNKKEKLEARGWVVGNTEDFLEMSSSEIAYIEIKLALAQKIKEQRAIKKLTQKEFARLIKSSQSRVAKMESGDATVSIDLMIRSLLALGLSQKEIFKDKILNNNNCIKQKKDQQLLYNCIHFNQCEQFLIYYWDMVYHIVKKSLEIRQASFGKADIEELRQEIFIRLFENECKKLRQYKDGDGLNLNGWIRLISNQTVGMYLRKRDRCGQLGCSPLVHIDTIREELGITDSEKDIIDKLTFEKLENDMKELAPLEQQVLKSHFFEGLEVKEIAEYLKKTENAVYQIKHRAIRKLKEHYRP